MKTFVRVVLGVCLAWTSAVLAADFQEGVQYTRIEPEPPQGKVGEPIEVDEFFMFSCPHCYHFEPYVLEWLKHKPEDIDFVRIPAMFGRYNNMHAQAYYALQAIGEEARLHEAFFAEIHKRRNRLTTREALDKFLASQGVDMKKFDEAMSSFAVAAKTNRAAALMRRYDIRGVPSLVVDGRYKSGRDLTFPDMPKLVEFLAEKVRQERKAAAQ